MKVICYTVLVGDYDTLHSPKYVSKEWDYVCFTNQPVQSNVWQIRPLQNIVTGDVIRTCRWHKMHPHLLFPDHDLSIYTDANIQITGPHLESFAEQFIANNTLIALPPHPERSCVYDEIDECMLTLRDCTLRIHNMEQLLKAEDFPKKAGLFENNVIIRRHKHPDILALDEEWWDFITTYSRRDQLSLTYLLRKHDIAAAHLIPVGETIRRHTGYHYRCHKHLQTKPTKRSWRRHSAKCIAALIPIRPWRHTVRKILSGNQSSRIHFSPARSEKT